MDRSKQTRLERTAARMRAKADAAYIREGERGWQRRRNHVEARDRRRQLAAHVAQMNAIENRKLIRAAEAVFDATFRHEPAKPEAPDSTDREARLMGNAEAEGRKRRRDAQQLRADQQKKAMDEYKRLKAEGIKTIGKVEASVEAATFEQLIEAGWGDYERHMIPADWKTKRPTLKQPPDSGIRLATKPNDPQGSTASRKLA